MTKCLNCGVELTIVPGKVQRRFCSDKCRKAAKRAGTRNKNAPGCPTTDELRTTNTKPTPDINLGQATPDKPEQGVILKPIPFAEPKRKRGEDIKTFHDLPPDVQRSIDSMSQHADNKVEDKAARTSRAIRYQHTFPNRYHSTGLN